MKKILLICMLVTSFSTFAETVNFNVKGMVCSMCAQGIKKKFAALGVNDVKVDLDKKLVTYKSEKKLSDKDITALIKDAGYDVDNIKRQ